MTRFTERDAENLSPEQATTLVRVLDLQARWDGLLVDKGRKTSLHDLQARQKANDALRTALRDYAAEYRNAGVPEPTQAVPDRLAVWCRTLRAVFRRAAGGSPAEVMGKVYRLADRIATRTGSEPVPRVGASDLAGAMEGLDAVIAWCDGLVPAAPPVRPKKDQAA